MPGLRRIKDIQGWSLAAQDGDIGKCSDFLFDDHHWTVRYIVADTRKWLPGRKVLISPIAIGTLEGLSNKLDVALTQEQIKDSPPLEDNAPVSRRYEIIFNQYFDWGNYWGESSIWGPHLYPRLLHRPDIKPIAEDDRLNLQEESPEDETNLRSAQEVIGYNIRATDNGLGHLEDLLVEEETWSLRYLVIDTRNWLPGGKWVLIPSSWAESIDWGEKIISVKVSAEKIKSSPEFDPSFPVDREYERVLYDYYGMPYYW